MKALEAFQKMVEKLTAMQQDQIHNVVNEYGPIVLAELEKRGKRYDPDPS